MENPTLNQQETPLTPYEDSLSDATKLYGEYRKELIEAENQNFGHSDTNNFIKIIPLAIQEKIYCHGITRGDGIQNLAALLNILSNETVKGDYGPLSGIAAGWSSADIILLSHYNKQLGIIDENNIRNNQLVKNEIGWKANVGAYVISNKYYPILNELKKLFPDKNIIRADEIPRFVDEETTLSN
jgi:hypothetical protein